MPDINALYQEYSEGTMDARKKDIYERAVKSGQVSLPEGKTLFTIPIVDIPVVQERAPGFKQTIATPEQIESYKTNVYDENQKGVFERAVQSGQIVLPETEQELSKEITSKEPGFIEGIVEQFTGEKRTTPEIEAMPYWHFMPEIENVSAKGFENALALFANPDPDEAVKMLKEINPGIKDRKDEKGNYILKSAIDGKEYALKPGLHRSDVTRGLAPAILFGLVTKGRGLRGQAGAAAGLQTGIEASQAALGGEFNPEQIPLAAATEFGGSMFGKGLSRLKGAVKGAVSPLQTAIKEAEERGISAMTSDVFPPETFIGKKLQSGLEHIPWIGTGQKRVRQQATRVQAIKDVLSEFDVDETTPAIKNLADDLVKKHWDDVSKYSNMKNDVIERLSGTEAVDTSKTIAAIDKSINNIERLGAPGKDAEVKFLKTFREAFSGKNLSDLESLRKSLGESIKNTELSTIKSDKAKYIDKIYSSLNDDMGDFIKATGERRDFTKWKVANKKLSADMNEMRNTVLKTVLNKADKTPEFVGNMLFSKKPSEIRLLYKELTPTGKKSAKIAILQKAVKDAGGIDELSTAKFTSSLKKLQNSTGVMFNETDKKVIQGLNNALKMTKRSETSSFLPPTGAQVVPIVTASFLTDLLGGPYAGASATFGIGALAQVYESKHVRNILLQLAKPKPGREQVLIKQLTSAIQAARQPRTYKKAEK